MKKAILTAVIIVTTCAASAYAADVNGNIEIGGRYLDVTGNKAKASEYKDAATGQGIVNIGAEFFSKGYYLELDAKSGFAIDKDKFMPEERTDQSYLLKGGQYESFKYSLFFNEIPHNITFGSQTMYYGGGSQYLVAPILTNVGAPTAAQTAAQVATSKANVLALKNAEIAQLFKAQNTVNYELLRKNYGVGSEVSLKSPFFFAFRAERNETNGTLPLGTYLNQLKEVPMPVNYLTDNLFMETGYRTKELIATLDGTISSFHNQNATMLLRYSNASQFISLPPGNTYYKMGASVKYDMPFIKSTFMARGSYSSLENEMNLFDPATVIGNFATFKGKINYTTASASVTSNPIQNLDTRVFVNYLNKMNDSNTGFMYGTAIAPTSVTEGFSYHKINTGLDVGYKLPAKTKVSTGYEYMNVVRSIREDSPQTIDHIVYVQAKNDLLDWMGGKVRYQHMYRESDFRQLIDPLGQAGTGFFRPVDTATKTQDAVKVTLDIEPIHNVSLGVEYAFKKDIYPNSPLGVQNETRNDLFFDANVLAGIFKFNPYADMEIMEQNSRHRVGNNLYYSSTATQYNWNDKAQNFYYAFGLNTDVSIIKDRLIGAINTRYEKSDGSESFTTTQTAVDPNNPILNNNALDNFIKKSITAKLTGIITKQLKATASFTLEKLKYNDRHCT
jgi:hypothetical protein